MNISGLLRMPQHLVSEVTADSMSSTSNCSTSNIIKHQMSQRLKILLDKAPVAAEVQLKHAWNPEDKSQNIMISENDPFTLFRQPVAQSTDCIRGKVSYESGLHVFEIKWPTKQRGTHPVIGVSTGNYKQLQCQHLKTS